MLRRHRPSIQEAQPELPNNHHALLRFRTDAVSRATGIPFRKVWVTKAVHRDRHTELTTYPSIADVNRYSYKVTGEILPRSILNVEPGERYISPPDFIEQLRPDRAVYNSPFKMKDRLESNFTPLISTIPMPALMDIVNWPKELRPEFHYRTIYTDRAEIREPKVDVYQTVYYPYPDIPWYRISLVGNVAIAEMTQHHYDEYLGVDLRHMLDNLLQEDFGIPGGSDIFFTPPIEQKYGKLAPIDEQKRRAFILAMTDEFRIYSLGRFATWRQILLDDVVKDVQVIEGYMTERDAYTRSMRGLRR